jgi:hypothetical protein
MRAIPGTQVKVVAGRIVLALLLHPFASAQEPVSTQAGGSQPQTVEPAPLADQLPDSPGAVQSRASLPQAVAAGKQVFQVTSQQPAPENAPVEQEPASPASTEAAADRVNAQSSEARQSPQWTPHEPLGTAAAESVQTTGVAASRPAGAAVAPAKQRRVRTILIRVGALVGVGVAVGTTMALSQGSPSKPPGSN